MGSEFREPSDDDAAALDALARRVSSALIRLPGPDLGVVVSESLRDVADILGADRSTLVEFAPPSRIAATVHTWARPGIPSFDRVRDMPPLLARIPARAPLPPGPSARIVAAVSGVA